MSAMARSRPKPATRRKASSSKPRASRPKSAPKSRKKRAVPRAKSRAAPKPPKRLKPPKSAKPAPIPGERRQSIAKSLMALGTGAFGGGLWAIIERVKRVSGGDLRDACDAFEIQLDALDDGALVGTVDEFDAAMNRAYDYNLWGAAYLIHGGCSDDTFWDFRTGLIALGKEIFEKALANPDSLADVEDVENRTLFEGFQYIPSKLVERRGLTTQRISHMPSRPTGENWSDESELEQRFPRLAARSN
jgi:hypothetical protein